ncbi:hypothetical protein LCGC14_2466880, partial [marine sediment metagenome]
PKYPHPLVVPDDFDGIDTIERFQDSCCRNCIKQYKEVKLDKQIKKKVSKILIDYYKRAGLVKAMEKPRNIYCTICEENNCACSSSDCFKIDRDFDVIATPSNEKQEI